MAAPKANELYSEMVKRGRKLFWAIGVVLLLGVFAAFTLTSVSPPGFEPTWLLADKSAKRKQTYYVIGPVGAKVDIAVTQGMWSLDMGMSEFVKKMDGEFKATDGWRVRKEATGHSTMWTRTEGTDGYTMYANDLGGKLMVTSHMSRRLSWPEKAQRWIRHLFRATA